MRDLVAGTTTVLDAAEAASGESSDHPAWSPDGTRIAYEHQPAAASSDRDIKVKTVGTAVPAASLTSGAAFDLKAAWSPNSQEIYFATSPTAPPTTQFDIVKKPAGALPATVPTGVATTNTVDEYQPSISPDGTKMCFTRQSMLGDTTTAEIFTATLPGAGSQTNISNDGTKGDINCTWSPDGLRIAHSSGTFNNAELVIRNADGSNLSLVENAAVDNEFDGNADWAPDGSPDCPDSTVTTPRNTPITLNLECTDTGPAYERTDPNGFVANNGGPANGTTSDDVPLGNPSTVKYTPNQNFTGTDTVKFASFDAFGFGTDQGTITINVRAPAAGGGAGGGPGPTPTAPKPRCGGKTATIVGTAGKNRLRGTRRADVIVGLGGNDTITGGGGRDRICGGSGRDRIGGGASNDRIAGGSGNDRVGGGSGNDSVKGERGNDRVSGGSGKDKLSGGTGRDRLDGGSGRDRLNGGSGRDRCKGGGGKDRGSRCEQRSAIP